LLLRAAFHFKSSILSMFLVAIPIITEVICWLKIQKARAQSVTIYMNPSYFQSRSSRLYARIRLATLLLLPMLANKAIQSIKNKEKYLHNR
jgi:hypothetical protein